MFSAPKANSQDATRTATARQVVRHAVAVSGDRSGGCTGLRSGLGSLTDIASGEGEFIFFCVFERLCCVRRLPVRSG